MKVIALALFSIPLFAQLDPNIILRSGQQNPGYTPPWVVAEAAMRVRLMQEQERMMAAQREAMSRQAVEENFKKGYETGITDGFENCRKAMLQQFQEYLPTLQQQIIQDAMRSIFTAASVTDLQAAVAQAEVYLAANPQDYQKKGMVLLFKARIAELTPPPTPEPAKQKAKKKAASTVGQRD